MADTTLICKGCGSEFIFTEGEQAFYKEKGFSNPQSCPGCRAKRKAEGQGNRFGTSNRPGR